MSLPLPRVPLPPQFGHAARVALAATLLVGVVYAGCVAILDRAVSARLVASVDTRLREHLAAPPRSGPPAAARPAAGSEAGPAGQGARVTMTTTWTRPPCSCGGPGPGKPGSR